MLLLWARDIAAAVPLADTSVFWVVLTTMVSGMLRVRRCANPSMGISRNIKIVACHGMSPLNQPSTLDMFLVLGLRFGSRQDAAPVVPCAAAGKRGVTARCALLNETKHPSPIGRQAARTCYLEKSRLGLVEHHNMVRVFRTGYCTVWEHVCTPPDFRHALDTFPTPVRAAHDEPGSLRAP